MIKDVEVIGLFATPIYLSSCYFDITKAVDVFENCKLYDSDPSVKEAFGSRSDDTYILDHPDCKELQDWIVSNINEYGYRVLGYQTQTFKVTQSWVSVKSTGQKHTPHTHPNSIISGVFYWQDGDIDPLTLYRPEQGGMQQHLKMNMNMGSAQASSYAWDVYNVNPRKHTLVLFPSYLKHSVGPIQNLAVRKSLAFNSMPAGTIGNKGGLDELDFSRLA